MSATPLIAAPITALELAQACGKALWANDIASKDTLGMQLLEVGVGRAVVRMPVQKLHLNGHNICHGGFIFTLADTTFAFACNSHNKPAVAAGAQIEFLRPTHEGDVLTCEGIEQTLQGRHGIYDMRVTNQRGEVVAMFRGKSAQIAGSVL